MEATEGGRVGLPLLLEEEEEEEPFQENGDMLQACGAYIISILSWLLGGDVKLRPCVLHFLVHT